MVLIAPDLDSLVVLDSAILKVGQVPQYGSESLSTLYARPYPSKRYRLLVIFARAKQHHVCFSPVGTELHKMLFYFIALV